MPRLPWWTSGQGGWWQAQRGQEGLDGAGQAEDEDQDKREGTQEMGRRQVGLDDDDARL